MLAQLAVAWRGESEGAGMLCCVLLIGFASWCPFSSSLRPDSQPQQLLPDTGAESLHAVCSQCLFVYTHNYSLLVRSCGRT